MGHSARGEGQVGPRGSTRIFISYSHKDEDLFEELRSHLSLLQRRGLIHTWHDRRIDPGADWQSEIDDHIYSSRIILLLISSDFIASDYCYDREMALAIERHEAGKARVVPIVVRPTDCRGAPFSKLQMLPKDALPISKWENRDEAFLDVVTRLSRILTDERDRWAQAESAGGKSPGSEGDATPERDVFEQMRAALLRLGLLSLLDDRREDFTAPDLTQICHKLEIRSRKSAWEALQYLLETGLVVRVEGERALYRSSDRGRNILERLRSVARIQIDSLGD